MIEREVTEKMLRKEHTTDILKEIAGWFVVTVLAFVYWIVMLLFASLVLISIWNPKFETLVNYSLVLTLLSSVAYLIYILRKRFRKEI